MKKLISLALALVLSLSLIACGAKQDDTPQTGADTPDTTQTAEKQKLIVGFDAEFPPFGFIAADGSYDGFDLAMAEELCSRLGWDFEAVPIVWDSKDAELAAGAAGLSSGLLYVPGKFAPPGEIVELMRVAARRDRLYATHLRSEGNELLEALGETIDCAREAGLRRLHISHFKTAGAANWEKLDAALELLEEAQKGGIAVTVDRYPYTESMTQLSVILPGKAGDLDDSALSRLLHSTEEREKLALELAASCPAAYWKTVTLVSTRSSAGRNHAGQTIAALAERAGRTPAEFAVELLAEDAAGTTAAFRGMSPENMRRILGLPFCMMGSDENARPADDSIGRCHPRGFGSAARFLRLRLDAGSPIEAAVRQMTGLAAETFQLADRGLVRPGLCADLAAFDPDEVDGTADFSNPHTPAAGIIFTVTGGEFVYRS